MISLIGGRGSGKSTVGRLLAERLGVRFADADDACEAAAGRTIADIFRNDGEPAFREIEAATIQKIIDAGDVGVLATGGGAVLREQTRVRLAAAGPVVWLTADAKVLAERVAADDVAKGGSRPSLTGRSPADEMADVLRERRPMYQSVATITEPVAERPPEEIARSILLRVDDRGAGGGR